MAVEEALKPLVDTTASWTADARKAITLTLPETKWSKLETGNSEDLRKAAEAIGDVVQTIKQGLDIVKQAIQVIKLLDSALLKPTVVATLAALTALENALNTLITDTTLYALFVPPQAPPAVGPALQRALIETGLTRADLGPGYLEQLYAWAAKGGDDVARSVEEAVQAAGTFTHADNRFALQFREGSGGNAGFAQAVVSSLYDIGDPARPQFSEQDLMVGLYLVAFAPDVLGPIEELLQLIRLLFKTTPVADTNIPVPAGLSATGAHPDIALRWAPLTTNTFYLKDETGKLVEHTITGILIHRGTSPKIFSERTPENIRLDEQRYEMMSSTPTTFATQYLDNDDKLRYGTTYYYVAYYEYCRADNTAVPLYGPLSQVAVYYKDEPRYALRQVAGTATPPNWVRMPALGAIGPMANFVETAIKVSGSIKANLTSASEQTTSFIDLITRTAESFERRARDFNEVLATIQRLLALNLNTGVYFKPILLGKGGTAGLAQDVMQSFSSSDENAPKFYNGEFSTGLVLVAGAPSGEALKPVLAILDVIMGGLSQLATALDDLIRAADKELTDTERRFTTQNIDDLGRYNQYLKIGAGDPGHCVPVTAPDVTFGDDFAPL